MDLAERDGPLLFTRWENYFLLAGLTRGTSSNHHRLWSGGSVVGLVLLWVYYSAQILFFGGAGSTKN